jgi:hypothetical protein
MAYELFNNKAAVFSSPQLTIRNRKIALSAAAGEILARVGAKFAHLLWDAAACRIAIQPTTKRDGNAFKVSVRKGKRGGTISAGAFLNYIQWRARQAVVVEVKWNESEGLLEASLPREYIGTGKSGRDASKQNPARPTR